MKKEITIFFADDNLTNEQSKIIANFGEVAFNPGSVRIYRTGYDKYFLDLAMYCNDIIGGYNAGKTFIHIPENKILSVSFDKK